MRGRGAVLRFFPNKERVMPEYHTADLILRSDNIFTADSDELFSGYIVISHGVISAILANDEDIRPWRGPTTHFRDLGERLICPGFCDNHTFFTGYMSMHRGVDLSATNTSAAALRRSGERCLTVQNLTTLFPIARWSRLIVTRAIAG
jgi:imidazolonepropionase-like amidohydrolase